MTWREVILIDYIYALFSVLAGILILDFSVILHARSTAPSHWLGRLPVELRYVVLLMLGLATVLTANQWIAGTVLFPLVIIAAAASVASSLPKLSRDELRLATQDIVALLALQTLLIFTISSLHQVDRFWLLEHHNHDSLFYFEGMRWALQSPLFVGGDAVSAEWGGLVNHFIGIDVPLYRAGTYTVAAWIQFFSPRVTGSGLFFNGAYSATLAWFAVKLLTSQRSPLLTSFFASLVSFSTGFLGALVNSNLATVLGSAAVMMVLALSFRDDLQIETRYGLMAGWCALAGHFYGEALFYAGLLVCLLFVSQLHKTIKVLSVRGAVRTLVLTGLAILILGNVAVFQAFSSLILISQIAKGGTWNAWYLHQVPLVWVGSFVGGAWISRYTIITALLVTPLGAAYALVDRKFRHSTLALAVLSLLAITYIEVSSYEYGEHKIVQLLGPAWSCLLSLASFHALERRAWWAKLLGATLASGLAFTSVVMVYNAQKGLDQLSGHHGLDFSMTKLTAHVQPGDRVVVDDSAWHEVEKFSKGHYLLFQLLSQSAKAFMPKLEGDELRGGYLRGLVGDTLHTTPTADWYIQGRSFATGDSVFRLDLGPLVFENADYSLYRVGPDRAVAVAGAGWNTGERGRAITTSPFEVETLAPSTEDFELAMEFTVAQAPPKGGSIVVTADDGSVLARVDASHTSAHFLIPEGWTRLTFQSSWNIQAPEPFLLIKRIDVSSNKRFKR